jgi:hypothetical protein
MPLKKIAWDRNPAGFPRAFLPLRKTAQEVFFTGWRKAHLFAVKKGTSQRGLTPTCHRPLGRQAENTDFFTRTK